VPRLDEDECRRRLGNTRHLVLATVHPDRGVDAVPVVGAIDGSTVWIPVDTVKPKSTTRLRRLANIATDPRVCLLAEHYGDDWDQLWWVRAHGTAQEVAGHDLHGVRAALAARFDQYAMADSVSSAIAVQVTGWTGWSAR
jgi:PPOX class probable F420-dependent enzyme